jgi:integral membrane protein
MSNPVRPLRGAALAEAVSYLVLLGIAMPMKYWWGMPLAVTVVGMLHGILFLLVLWLLVRARMHADWPWPRVGLVFVASLVPLWPFFLDRRVKRWVDASAAA